METTARTLKNSRAYRANWQRQYRLSHREDILKYRREWREKNKDRVNELARKWRKENKERVAFTTALYRDRNRERVNDHSLRWQKQNRDKVYLRNARRRAKKAQVEHAPYLRKEIFDRDKGICHICNLQISWDTPAKHPKSFSVDHIIPIYLGGGDTPGNVASAHYGCNSSKGIKL